MIKFWPIISLLLAADASESFAQDAVFPKTVRAIPQAETSPDGRTIDVVGVQLGDSWENVKQAMEQRFGIQAVEAPAQVMSIVKNSVFFPYYHHYIIKGERAMKAAGSESMIVQFSTAVTEERAQSIFRFVDGGLSDISVKETMDGLKKKYGPVSWEDYSGHARAVWVWHDGKHIDFKSDPINIDADVGSPEYCANIGDWEGQYHFGEASEWQATKCDTVIHIEFVGGNSAGLKRTFSFEATDFKRIRISSQLADTELQLEFDDFQEGKKGMTPDL